MQKPNMYNCNLKLEEKCPGCTNPNTKQHHEGCSLSQKNNQIQLTKQQEKEIAQNIEKIKIIVGEKGVQDSFDIFRITEQQKQEINQNKEQIDQNSQNNQIELTKQQEQQNQNKEQIDQNSQNNQIDQNNNNAPRIFFICGKICCCIALTVAGAACLSGSGYLITSGCCAKTTSFLFCPDKCLCCPINNPALCDYLLHNNCCRRPRQ